MQLYRDVLVFPGGPHELLLPADCAACGAPAALAQLESGRREPPLLVSYCARCAARRARAARFPWVASAAVALAVGAASLVAWWLWPWAPPFGTLALGFGVGLVVLLSALARGASLTKRAIVVALDAEGHLVCFSADLARRIALRNGLEPKRKRARLFGQAALAPSVTFVLALALAELGYRFHHPRLHALNLGDEALELWIDDRSQGELVPSGYDARAALLVRRVPAGRRRLELRRRDGSLLERAQVTLVRGHEHLYARASAEHCFWLEVTGYGRKRSRRVVPLVGAPRFWSLEPPVDAWFVATPEPSNADTRSSGGSLTAVRHARCERAPLPR